MHFVLVPWLLLASSAASTSGTIYRWTDSAGQTHYSDRPPPDESSDIRRSPLPSAGNATVQGLRDAERRILQDSEKRRRQRETAAAVRSAKAGLELSRRREACRTALDRMHSTRLHEQRKQQSDFLRRHCW